MPAQGNALGVDCPGNRKPCKGDTTCFALSGLAGRLSHLTQGVALGFHVVPLRGGKQQTLDG